MSCGGARPAQLVEGEIWLGPPSSFPRGSVTRIDEGPCFVLHDQQGLYALTAVCTHQHGLIAPDADRLRCTCGGSVFDRQGATVEGPATAPLDQLKLTLRDGLVVVDTAAVVAAGERTPART